MTRIPMPKALTAENGAKALLMGEFFEEIKINCPDCDGMDTIDDETYDLCSCGKCSGAGTVRQKVPVSWTTIKEIYKTTVNFFNKA